MVGPLFSSADDARFGTVLSLDHSVDCNETGVPGPSELTIMLGYWGPCG